MHVPSDWNYLVLKKNFLLFSELSKCISSKYFLQTESWTAVLHFRHYHSTVYTLCENSHIFTIVCVSIIVQRVATQSSLFIILLVHSTCFGCQPYPSSGVHKTVTTAFVTGHIFCAATSFQRGQAIIRSTQNCNYSLRYWSYFFVQLPPSNVDKLSSGVHKTVTTASGISHILCAATSLQRGQAIIRSTQNCNYSLRYWSYFLCSYLLPTWTSYHQDYTKL